MPDTITVRGEGLTVDLLLWRRDGVRGRALVERTYETNPGLADLGPVLPLGTVVVLPDPEPFLPFRERPIVTLF